MMYQEITELYEQLYNELVRWCQNMTLDPYKAQELVQEGFVKAIDHYDEVKELEPNQRRAWLYRTIKNLFIDDYRKCKRETLTDSFTEGQTQLMIQPDKYSELEMIQLINSLPGDEGKIFTMKYLGGMTSGQIGKILDLPPGTVRSKLSDARKHIKERMTL